MLSIIGSSSERKYCVAATQVLWGGLLKTFLETFFKISFKFSITKYHAVRFHSYSPSKVFARAFSFSTEEKTFSILENGFSLEAIRREGDVNFSDVQYKPIITSLKKVNLHTVGNSTRIYGAQHNMSLLFQRQRNVQGVLWRWHGEYPVLESSTTFVCALEQSICLQNQKCFNKRTNGSYMTKLVLGYILGREKNFGLFPERGFER